jgi:cell division protein FtsB
MAKRAASKPKQTPLLPAEHAGKDRSFRSHHGRELSTLVHVIEFLLEIEVKTMAVDQKIVDAQAALDSKIAALDAKVDAFVAAHSANSAADVQAVVDKLTAEGAALDATAAKLNPPA